jgi:hypothetical protein
MFDFVDNKQRGRSMRSILEEFLLFSGTAAFVTGVVIAAASLIG